MMISFIISVVFLCDVCAGFANNSVNNSSKRMTMLVRNQVKGASTTRLYGWLDAFLPKEEDMNAADERRRMQYPEQYSATYELSTITLPEDDDNDDYKLIRPLLKQTQLESRPIQLVYDANIHGWSAKSFHDNVDCLGAAVVLAEVDDNGGNGNNNNMIIGGYNPKGWASMGNARPSVAAFLFYQTSSASSSSSSSSNNIPSFQKLCKVGGGGLACAKDDPNYGISFGPDGLVIPLIAGKERMASSKLGTYYERSPIDNDRTTLFSNSNNGSGIVKLKSLKVFVGVYDNKDEIPYSGAVMDMTSG